MSQKEELEKIRKVFSPSISDIAFVFGVKNYIVYLWLDEIPMEDRHKETLKSLSEAADIVKESGTVITGWMFRRKIFNGKNMLEAIKNGESAQELAKKLVEITKIESKQRDRLEVLLVNRKPCNPEADWPADADVE
jgi:hypothetical protein